MVWPWQRKREAALPALAEADVLELVRAEARQATLAELTRLNQTPYGLPDPVGRPPDGLPYRWNNPWLYTVAQPPYKPPGSPVTVDTLRNLANHCDVVRAAILHLTREVHAVPIRVVARDPENKGDETKRRCAEALAWLDTRKGGLGGIDSRRAHFEAQCIDDLSIVGAAAVFFQSNRRRELTEVIAIDASTVRPRVDIYGWDADHPYEQWVYGVQMRTFKRDELVYDGIYPISFSPYFKSPTEYLISVIDSTLSADQWNNAWLTEGTGGTEKLALPADWLPEQVMSFQSYWSALLKGNINERQRTLFVPSGTSKLNDPSRKDQDFQEFQLWLMRRVCSIFGVQPASIGYSGEQYKVTQEKSVNQTTQFGAGVLLEWRRAIYDNVLERLGFSDLCVQDISGEEESEDARAKRLTLLVSGAVMTPNEARAVEGLGPQEGGDTLLVMTTLQPLAHALVMPPELTKPGARKVTSETGDGAKPTEAKPTAVQRGLDDWERLSLKRFAGGKVEPLLYRGLDDDLTQRVYAGLVNCHDKQAIQAVFAAHRETE